MPDNGGAEFGYLGRRTKYTTGNSPHSVGGVEMTIPCYLFVNSTLLPNTDNLVSTVHWLA